MTRRDRTVFVSLLVLSSDRSIHVLYPSGGAVGAAIELKARTARPIGYSAANLQSRVTHA